jgi:hypothetical protein
MTCRHEAVRCLNEYELIRKYSCDLCGGVMMCSCDREIGERFLRQQLAQGCVLETQARVPVTLGFVERVCRECRGLSSEPHPKAAIPGRTSKIKRYYWREIAFQTLLRFAERAESAGLDPRSPYATAAGKLREEVELEVLQEIKVSHARSPKYDFHEPSQDATLAKYGVEVVRLDGAFAPKSEATGVGIFDGEEIVSAEEFVSRHYSRVGWSVLFCESRPLHVLFGIYMWVLIQDPTDPLCEMRGFGAKVDYPSRSLTKGQQLWTLHPRDFGTSGYAQRRAEAIDKHFESMLPPDRGALLWLFNYWTEGSTVLRDYLWAHDTDDVASARRLVEILPAEVTVRVLRYLVGDYWGRYLGWPDILAYKSDQYFFAEVKASRDRLSGDQKRWIGDNANDLALPFKVVKIHRAATAR